MVDEKAASLRVAHATTADQATTATTATTATRAASSASADLALDASKLAGKPAQEYGNSVLFVTSASLYTERARELRFTITGLPLDQEYLLDYNFAFLQDPGARVGCYVDFTNRPAPGATSGNSRSTLGFVSSSTLVRHVDDGMDHEPLIRCIAEKGTIAIADARSSTNGSLITLLKVDQTELISASASTLP